MTARRPPRKRAGAATGPRRFDGALRDIRTEADDLGVSVKMLRSQVSRGLIPHRRLGSRILFFHDEVLEYLRRLPGTTLEAALENVAMRRGESGR